METFSSKKSRLIKKISSASDMVPFSDYLLDFMDCYGLNNTQQATIEQLEEYIINKNIDAILGETPQRGLF